MKRLRCGIYPPDGICLRRNLLRVIWPSGGICYAEFAMRHLPFGREFAMRNLLYTICPWCVICFAKLPLITSDVCVR